MTMENDRTPKKADALVLSCMDLRFIDETALLMNEIGLHNRYDHVVIAGASLGVRTGRFTDAAGKEHDLSSFGQTFWTHVELARKLHAIDKIVIVEHPDCGAYKWINHAASADERAQHVEQSLALREEILKRHPDLGVECYLVHVTRPDRLDGSR